MDSDWASVPTWPFFVVRSRWRRCMTRTSAYDAPRSRAVSRALVQKSHMRIAVRSSVNSVYGTGDCMISVKASFCPSPRYRKSLVHSSLPHFGASATDLEDLDSAFSISPCRSISAFFLRSIYVIEDELMSIPAKGKLSLAAFGTGRAFVRFVNRINLDEVAVLNIPIRGAAITAPRWKKIARRKTLRAFLPGGEVVLLLGRELVEFVTHGFEFEARDFAVEMLGNDVDLRLHALVILEQILSRKRLIGEAHIHHGGGMAFGGGEIHEAPFAEEVHFAISLQDIFIDERANFALAAGQFLQRGNVDFHVEGAGVTT